MIKTPSTIDLPEIYEEQRIEIERIISHLNEKQFEVFYREVRYKYESFFRETLVPRSQIKNLNQAYLDKVWNWAEARTLVNVSCGLYPSIIINPNIFKKEKPNYDYSESRHQQLPFQSVRESGSTRAEVDERALFASFLDW